MTSTESREKTLNTFLVLLLFSLVGNACADFALVWHAVGQMNPGSGDSASASKLLSTFYIGQSLGVIFLAPVLSTWIDRYSRRWMSVSLDIAYATTLLLMLAVSHLGFLNIQTLLPFATLTAALGSLHRNAIGFGALKSASQELGVTRVVAKFSATSFLTNVLGSALSGLAYRHLGLGGCLIFAILTFLPMPLIYFRLFPTKETAPSPERSAPVFQDMREGLLWIIRDPILRTNSLSIALWNVASNIFPGIVGIAFQKSFPGRSDYASFAVAGAILMGVLAFRPMENVAKRLPLSFLMAVALLPATLILIACGVWPGPIPFALAFLFHCCGASLVNIMSGSVRLKRAPNHLLGRINSAHSAIVHIGQMTGGLLLIPILDRRLDLGAGAIVMAFILSAFVAYLFLPSRRLADALEAS